MSIDSPDKADLADLFALAEGDPVQAVSPEQLATIKAGGRRRRRINHLMAAAPVTLVAAGVVAGGVALSSGGHHPTSRLAVTPAASSKPTTHAKTAAAPAPCDQAGAHHYLVAAEIPANLGDRKDAVPTAAVPIEITWPGAAVGDPNFDFKVACADSVTGSGTTVDINGASGTLSHSDPTNLGPTSTIAWSPAPGFVISYSSFGGSNGPVSDTALIAMARAVPTA